MRRKSFLISALAILLTLSCAACTAAPPPTGTPPVSGPAFTTTPASTPTPTSEPTVSPETSVPSGTPTLAPPVLPSATPEQTPEPPPMDGDDFPSTTEIPVTLEGQTEIFTGSLRISDLGYAIYLLPDFVFMPTPDGDIIRPAGESQPRGIEMTISLADPDTPVPDSYETGDQQLVEYDRVARSGLTFEVRMVCPVEAFMSGAEMLRAMWETLR